MNHEWKFIASKIEINVLGKSVRKKQNISESGLYYRVLEDDINIHIVGFFCKLHYSIRKDISSISWKFFKDGKFTITSNNKSVIFFSNAIPSSIFNLIESIYTITPHCLIPPFVAVGHNLGSNLDINREHVIFRKRKSTTEIILRGTKKQDCFDEVKEESNAYKAKTSLKLHSKMNKNLHHLPDDLLFYILSMLIFPNYKCGTSGSNIFFKDDLLKSTSIAFVNHKLLKFFQNNLWEISINKKMNNRPYCLSNNCYKLGSILVNNRYLRDPEIKWFASSIHSSSSINKFSIIGNNNVSELTLEMFFSRLKHLECIEIIDCKKISVNFVFKLLKTLSNVKFLRIGSLSAKIHSTNNQPFDTLNSQVNETKKSIIKGFEVFKLVYLELLYCSEITKISFIKNFCSTLEYLDLRGCVNIPESEFEYLFCHMEKLKVLILANSSINDKKLNILLDNCYQLETLDISNCNASDSVLRKIPFKLKNILGLKLSYCSNLSIESLIKLLSYCKHLETLDLTGCYQIENKLINFQIEAKISNNLRRIGIHRLSINSRRFKSWIAENTEINSIKAQLEVIENNELPISEFVQKYQVLRSSYLERKRPIWIC